MTEGPFFSIILPTRNRPSLLESAIQSVLLQGFKDVELIISDNSTNDDSQKIISKYSNDTRVQSFKPERELNMLEHWEYASKKARGKYIFILTDRNVFVNNALQLIHDSIIQHENVNCFVIGIQSFNENSGTFKKKRDTSQFVTLKTSDLLHNFLSTTWSISTKSKCIDYCYPKSLNSFILNDLLKDFRNQFGSYFDLPQIKTPDYSSFFINCHVLNEVSYIGKTLLLRQGNEESNGGKVNKGDTSYLSSLNSTQLNVCDFMVNLPLVYNFVFNDYAIIHQKLNSSIITDRSIIFNYYENLLFEIESKDKNVYETELLVSMKEIIFQQMRKQNFSEQQIIQAVEKSVQRNIAFNKVYESFFINLDIHLKDFLSLRFKETSFVNKIIRFKYSSILQAAGFKEF